MLKYNKKFTEKNLFYLGSNYFFIAQKMMARQTPAPTGKRPFLVKVIIQQPIENMTAAMSRTSSGGTLIDLVFV